MPFLQDIALQGTNSGDVQAQIDSLVKQLNNWGRAISNEGLTTVYKDNSGTPRILIGVLPDGTTGIVMSKEGTSVLDVFG